MKPYLVFAGDDYYPLGGWGDYIGSADTMEEALKLVPKNSDWRWHHVVHDGAIVEKEDS